MIVIGMNWTFNDSYGDEHLMTVTGMNWTFNDSYRDELDI